MTTTLTTQPPQAAEEPRDRADLRSQRAVADFIRQERTWLRRMAGEMKCLGMTRTDMLIQPFIDKYKNLRLEHRPHQDAPAEAGPHPAHAQILADIRSIGHRLKREGRKGIDYHNRFCRAVATLGEAYGYRGFNECAADYVDDGAQATPAPVAGRMDAVWALDRQPRVLFEIDSTVKRASVIKLLTCAAPHRYWIYFGPDLWRFRADLARWDPRREITPIVIPVAWKPT